MQQSLFTPESSESNVGPARPRVLVVEDQETIQDMLLTVFRRAGFETIVAATVAEALAHLDHSPDFCTLDLHLPDGSGTKVLERIRARRLAVRVAVTTGANDATLLAEAMKLHPERIYQKPFSVTDLVAWIRDVQGKDAERAVAEGQSRK